MLNDYYDYVKTLKPVLNAKCLACSYCIILWQFSVLVNYAFAHQNFIYIYFNFSQNIILNVINLNVFFIIIFLLVNFFVL